MADPLSVRVVPAEHLTPHEVDRWARLQAADPRMHHPSLHPAFTVSAAAVVAGVEVGIVEASGEPVGFFPFQRVAAGIGKAVAWCLSDQQGVIVRTGVDWNALDLVRGCGLRAWHFDHLIADQRPFQPFHHCLDGAAYVDLEAGYEGYERARRDAGSRVFASAARKHRKLGREVGPVRFVAHTVDEEPFRALVAWKRTQLYQARFFDVFRLPWVEPLLDLMRHANRGGLSAMLSALYAGDRLVAVHLSLRAGGMVSSWIPAHDDTYARYSPGLLLHLELMKHAAQEGVTRIDLGRGLNQLKQRLMSGTVPLAIGAVESGAVRRALRRSWSQTRALISSGPLQGKPLRVLRRVRSWARRD